MILERFNSIALYQQYVVRGIDEEIAKIYNSKSYPAILGSKMFKMQCLEKLNQKKVEESGPDIKRTNAVPTIIEHIKKIATYFDIDVQKIIKCKRVKENCNYSV